MCTYKLAHYNKCGCIKEESILRCGQCGPHNGRRRFGPTKREPGIDEETGKCGDFPNCKGSSSDAPDAAERYARGLGPRPSTGHIAVPDEGTTPGPTMAPTPGSLARQTEQQADRPPSYSEIYPESRQNNLLRTAPISAAHARIPQIVITEHGSAMVTGQAHAVPRMNNQAVHLNSRLSGPNESRNRAVGSYREGSQALRAGNLPSRYGPDQGRSNESFDHRRELVGEGQRSSSNIGQRGPERHSDGSRERTGEVSGTSSSPAQAVLRQQVRSLEEASSSTSPRSLANRLLPWLARKKEQSSLENIYEVLCYVRDIDNPIINGDLGGVAFWRGWATGM